MNKLQKLAATAQAKTIRALGRAKAKLREDGGMSTSTEHLVWALLAVVIVGAIGLFVMNLIDDSILPAWGDKILEILNLGS